VLSEQVQHRVGRKVCAVGQTFCVGSSSSERGKGPSGRANGGTGNGTGLIEAAEKGPRYQVRCFLALKKGVGGEQRRLLAGRRVMGVSSFLDCRSEFSTWSCRVAGARKKGKRKKIYQRSGCGSQKTNRDKKWISGNLDDCLYSVRSAAAGNCCGGTVFRWLGQDSRSQFRAKRCHGLRTSDRGRGTENFANVCTLTRKQG